LNIPNIISIGRLLAVPVTIWLILDGAILAAFWLFVAAGISDALDGFLAKRFDMETELGAYLDPLADKALLVSVYITMGIEGQIADWLVIMVVFRDALIIGGAIVFQTITQSLSMEPLFISKVNTLAQIVLAATVLGSYGFSVDLGFFLNMMVAIVALTTCLSGFFYVVKWTDKATSMEDGE